MTDEQKQIEEIPQNLRDKFPNVKFKRPPKPDCRFCKGTGIRFVKKQNRETFCICTFVSHDFCEEAGLLLAKTAKRLREEMNSNDRTTKTN